MQTPIRSAGALSVALVLAVLTGCSEIATSTPDASKITASPVAPAQQMRLTTDTDVELTAPTNPVEATPTSVPNSSIVTDYWTDTDNTGKVHTIVRYDCATGHNKYVIFMSGATVTDGNGFYARYDRTTPSASETTSRDLLNVTLTFGGTPTKLQSGTFGVFVKLFTDEQRADKATTFWADDVAVDPLGLTLERGLKLNNKLFTQNVVGRSISDVVLCIPHSN